MKERREGEKNGEMKGLWYGHHTFGLGTFISPRLIDFILIHTMHQAGELKRTIQYLLESFVNYNNMYNNFRTV